MSAQVSVVIAAYNRATLLPRAIASALAQDVDVEGVVVDDGSTDDTPTVLRTFDARVHALHQDNTERGAARNAGVAAATAPLVAFLDSDDEYLPGHLSALVAALERDPGAGLAYRQARYVTAAGAVSDPLPRDPVAGDVLLECAIQNRWALSAAMVRRSLFDRVGGFDPGRDLSGAEDWELWVRCAAAARVVHVPGPGVLLNIHPGNTVGDAARMARAIRAARARMLARPEIAARTAAHERQLVGGLEASVARAYVLAGDVATARRRIGAALRARPGLAFERPLQRMAARAALSSLGR